MKKISRVLKKALFPLLALAVLLAVNALVDPETFRSWLPLFGFIYIVLVYAHFETRCDNISMDLEALEEALDRLEPDYHHRSHRFRFKKDWEEPK